MSQQQNAHIVNNSSEGVLACRHVAARPIFHKEFGAFLARLRETRTGWNQSDAVRFIKSPLVTRQKLLHLEAGKTQDPDPDLLRVLAKAYQEPYESVIKHLVSSRYGIEADWHTSRVRSDTRRGREEGSSVRPSVPSYSQDALRAAAILYNTGQELQKRAGEILRRHAPISRSDATARRQLRGGFRAESDPGDERK